MTTDPGPARIAIADLPEGREVTTYALCSEREVATDRNGKQFLRLKLRDASGEVKCIHFDPAPEVVAELTAGDVVEVGGTYSVHAQYGPQFQLRRLRRMAPGEFDLAPLVPVSPIDAGELRDRVVRLVDSVAEPHLQALLRRALDPGREPGTTFAVVPAAVKNHHAYVHGLLEHSLAVAEAAAAVAALTPSVDRDLVVAGGLLHDIGKVAAYSPDVLAPGLTDVGRLHGEIVIGTQLIAGLIAEQPDFPPECATQLLHIVVAHHGEREKGSPATPATREAIVVHFCDDMTARIAAFDEAQRRSPDGARWSQRVNMLEGMAYLVPAESPGEPVDASFDESPDALADVADATPATDRDDFGDDAPGEDDEIEFGDEESQSGAESPDDPPETLFTDL